MNQQIEEIQSRINSEIGKLQLFNYDYPLAIRSAMISFELIACDLAALDRLRAFEGEKTPVSYISQIIEYEDSICSLVPEIWRRCRSVSSYNTTLNLELMEVGMQAINEFAKICRVRNQMFETQIGNEIGISIDKEKVRFSLLGDVPKRQVRKWIRRSQAGGEMGAEIAKQMTEFERSNKFAKQIEVIHSPYDALAQVHGFESTMSLGSYTMDQYLWFWASLRSISFAKHGKNEDKLISARRKGIKFSASDVLEILRKDKLVSMIVEQTKIPRLTVEQIVSELTYDGFVHQSSIYIKPLVPIGADFLAFSPHQIVLLDKIRNLRQRLIQTKPSVYEGIRQKIAKNMVRNIAQSLREMGYVAVPETKIADEQGIQLTDIDILATKNELILAIQVKNINPPDSYEENFRAFEEVRKAQKQMDHSISYIKNNEKSVLKLLGANWKENDQYSLKGLIVTGASLQTGTSDFIWPCIDIHELRKAISNLEKGTPPVEEQDTGFFQSTFGRFRIGGLLFEVPVGTSEDGVDHIDLEQYENTDAILRSLSWDNS